MVWQAAALGLDGGRQRDIDKLIEDAENAATDFEEPLEQNRALALVALIRGDVAEAQTLYQRVLEERPLAATRTYDLVYLSLLADIHRGDLTYFAIREWFKAELVLD